MIFIYDDGIHNNGALMATLHDTMPNHIVRYCTASMIINNCLDNAQLLVMPGGADLYFCEKLNGIGNQKIKSFVESGGAYLGICAGAYYACSAIDWNMGEIAGARELAFYDGMAIGPVFEWVEKPNDIYNGSWVSDASLKTKDGNSLTHYNGGPVFSEPKTENETVLARYDSLPDSPAAIVCGTYGDGQYILSSPHIELYGDALTNGLYKHQNKSHGFEKETVTRLTPYRAQQQHLFKTLITTLV